MRNIWTIAKREYDHYFVSPIAYVVAFMILLVLGILFAADMLYFTQNSFQLYGYTPDASRIVSPFAFLLVLSTPALTMRLLADETRMGTMELLLTAPVRDFELIVGKWLGGILFMLTLIVVSLIYPLILHNLVDPGIDQKLLLSSYLGLILLAAAFLALGVGISAIFSNQIAAFFATLGLLVFLWWLIGFPATIIPTGADVFNYLNMKAHFDKLISGSIYFADVIYYLSMIALGLFTGTMAIEIRRWR